MELDDFVKTEKLMETMAKGIDITLKRYVGKMGFALIVFELGKPGISNYVSNASREDMIKSLREAADRLEKNQDIPRAHSTIQ